MLVKSVAAAVAMSLSLVTLAQATVVQYGGVEAGGQKFALLDEVTGFEWLGPRHTVGLTYSQVLLSSWVQDQGFRFATQAELLHMLNSAGAQIGPPVMAGSHHTVGNVAAMQQLISMLGATYVNNPPSQGDDFGQQSVYGVTSDLYDDGWGLYFGKQSHTYTYFSSSATNAFLVPDGQWLWDSKDNLVGAFLVRPVPAVPEPSGVLLFAVGAAVVTWGRRKA